MQSVVFLRGTNISSTCTVRVPGYIPVSDKGLYLGSLKRPGACAPDYSYDRFSHLKLNFGSHKEIFD